MQHIQDKLLGLNAQTKSRGRIIQEGEGSSGIGCGGAVGGGELRGMFAKVGQ